MTENTSIQSVTYIIAANRLAGEYLALALRADRFAKAIICEKLPSNRNKKLVFVMDAALAPLPPGECVQRLLQLFPTSRFVVVDRARTDHEIVGLLRLGVHGYVEHPAVMTSLGSTVKRVRSGRMGVSQAVMQTYVELTARSKHSDTIISPTTIRESEVLELAKKRMSNKEIGAILNIRESTVKFHLTNIFGKLQLGNRHDLERRADVLPIWKELIADSRNDPNQKVS